MSRGSLQKAIRQGLCEVDGCPELAVDRKIQPGQCISMNLPGYDSKLEPAAEPIDIIWHDDCLAVCNKPSNLTVHPCPSCGETTAVHRLIAIFPQLAAMGGERPGIVHRLDKDTSGLMLLALDEAARLRLTEAFAERKIQKEYLALVFGATPLTGECHEPLGRHPQLRTRMAVVPEKNGGRAAITKWRRLWSSNNVSLLAVRIHTGRTHQIRVHLAHCGFPILGDPVYAPAAVRSMAPRQMLHAWQLWLQHPVSGRPLHFMTPPPTDFKSVALENGQNMLRVVITGNPGCGKSTFRENLEKYGMPGISADAIVSGLYSRNGHVSQWLLHRALNEALTVRGDVNKDALFEILRSRPDIKHELEAFVHALVGDRIVDFWNEQQAKHKLWAVAEVPLYFECGWHNSLHPRPFAVGIHCPEELRWKRLNKNRAWNQDKIATIEQWQWPENKKMAACDMVIENTGSPELLGDMARNFLERLEEIRDARQVRLINDLEKIWGQEAADV